MKLRGRLWKLDYLVGVATEESRRREGHFRDVFVKMFHDEEAAGKPITYLVPVNPAVYAPMGFTFIGNVASYELTEEAKQTLTRTVCQDTPEDCGRAAVYMEQWLGARYEMYTCLLYTSDAADELDGVDLGGRRIIKKIFFQAEDGIRDRSVSRGLRRCV